MKKLAQLYEGKAKKVYSTEDPNVVIVSYKDDATAFDGLKKGTITGKGAINNQMTNFLMQQLEKAGVPTHFVQELSERETAVKKVSIVPLEVIVRNIAAGSLAKRLGLPEGTKLGKTVLEYCYKDDALAGDGASFQAVEGGGVVLIVHDVQLGVVGFKHLFGFAFVQLLQFFHDLLLLHF